MIEVKLDDLVRGPAKDTGVFDKVILGFQALFPVKEGEALHSAIQTSFETGLKIGYQAGKYFSEFEKKSNEIAKISIETLKNSIESEQKLLEKRKDYDTVTSIRSEEKKS
ncbi:MAG: hypothetical protein ABRQ38_13600 [Candidatus Eremiobacterota bacterium]